LAGALIGFKAGSCRSADDTFGPCGAHKKAGAMWGSSFCETALQYRIKYKPIKDLGYLTETKILKEEKTLYTIMIINPNDPFASIFFKNSSKILTFLVFLQFSCFYPRQGRSDRGIWGRNNGNNRRKKLKRAEIWLTVTGASMFLGLPFLGRLVIYASHTVNIGKWSAAGVFYVVHRIGRYVGYFALADRQGFFFID